jgi:urease accessory protein UreE
MKVLLDLVSIAISGLIIVEKETSHHQVSIYIIENSEAPSQTTKRLNQTIVGIFAQLFQTRKAVERFVSNGQKSISVALPYGRKHLGDARDIVVTGTNKAY